MHADELFLRGAPHARASAADRTDVVAHAKNNAMLYSLRKSFASRSTAHQTLRASD